MEYGKRIIVLCRALTQKQEVINKRLVDQLIRSGTSVGANYREANETETKKDFKFKIRIALKEAKETEYWIALVSDANPDLSARMQPLVGETRELIKILAAILEKSK